MLVLSHVLKREAFSSSKEDIKQLMKVRIVHLKNIRQSVMDNGELPETVTAVRGAAAENYDDSKQQAILTGLYTSIT